MGIRTITNYLKILLVVLLLCTFRSLWEIHTENSILAILQHTMQDVKSHVRVNIDTSTAAWTFTTSTTRAKAHMMAELICETPEEYRTTAQIRKLCELLNVDEINIIDEKGIIIASNVPECIGFDMSSTAQTAEFMPALTDKDFFLAQRPQPQGKNPNLLVQYTGVPRKDKPGILQIGSHAATIRDFSKRFYLKQNLANIKTKPLDWLEITPMNEKSPAPREGPFLAQHGNRLYMCLESAVASWRIHIGSPAANQRWIAVAPWLYLADAVFTIALCLLYVPWLRNCLKRHNPVAGTSIRTEAVGTVANHGMFFGFLHSTVFQACVVLFLIIMTVTWIIAGQTGRQSAAKMLILSLDNLLDNNANYLADTPLSYVGNALCQYYGSPENMMDVDLQKLCSIYDVDSISVIDKNGVIINSNDNVIGHHMDAHADSGAFNCLLHGQRIFTQPFRKSVSPPYALTKYVGVAFPDSCGYVQLGLLFRGLNKNFQFIMEKNCRDLSIWNSGFFVSMDSNVLTIISSGYKYSRPNETLSSIGGCMPVIQANPPRKPFEMTLYGQNCICIYDVLQDYTYIAAVPVADIIAERNSTLITVAIILAIVLAIGGAFASRLTTLVQRLKYFIATEKKRTEADLATAKTVQTSALPNPMARRDGLAIDAVMRPAREVGGDFYDYYFLPSGKLFFMIADVSGKGIPAAMFMMRAKTIISACISKAPSLQDAVTMANQELSGCNEAQLFVTAWLAICDPVDGSIDYVNAGHNPPLLKQGTQAAEYLKSTPNFVLGMMDDIQYQAHHARLEHGGMLCLYTDGVTEAQNTRGEFYEDERLRAAVSREQSAVIPAVLDELERFSAGAEQFDDITMLILTRD